MRAGVSTLSLTLSTDIFPLPVALYAHTVMFAQPSGPTLLLERCRSVVPRAIHAHVEGIAPAVRHRLCCRLLSAPHHRVSESIPAITNAAVNPGSIHNKEEARDVTRNPRSKQHTRILSDSLHRVHPIPQSVLLTFKINVSINIFQSGLRFLGMK